MNKNLLNFSRYFSYTLIVICILSIILYSFKDIILTFETYLQKPITGCKLKDMYAFGTYFSFIYLFMKKL